MSRRKYTTDFYDLFRPLSEHELVKDSTCCSDRNGTRQDSPTGGSHCFLLRPSVLDRHSPDGRPIRVRSWVESTFPRLRASWLASERRIALWAISEQHQGAGFLPEPAAMVG